MLSWGSLVVVRIREEIIHVSIIQLRITRIPQLRPSLVHIHLAVVFPLLKPVGIFPLFFPFVFFFLTATNSLLLALDTTSYTSFAHKIMIWNRRCFMHIITIGILIFPNAKLWYLVFLLYILCFVMRIIARDTLTKKRCIFIFLCLIICARILLWRIWVLPWNSMLQTIFVYYTQVLGWSSFIDL